MIAHHREDQAETILMRLAKGSGVEGLAGMAPQSLRDDLRLLRPFLTLPKQRLLATCETAGIAYVTDPSNLSEKFARGRLRTLAPLLEKEGLTTETLLDLGARAAEASEALDHYTRDFLRAAAVCDIGGSIRLERSRLNLVPRAIALRALTACLRYIHDDDHPPERAALAGLLDALSAGKTGRTLYGCLIAINDDTATLLREPCAATEILPFSYDIPLLWDKRWHVSGSAGNAPNLTIRALGNPPHDVLDRLSPRLRHDLPQGRIRATLPAVWQGDSLFAIPSFDSEAPLRLAFRKQGFP
jgi:tRNA(Ile)-lysidine synthase